MSSLINALPLVQDLLPILLPASVHVTPSHTLEAGVGTDQTEGMVRKGAIVGKSDKVCASVMIARPHSTSAVHHHGAQDTIVYARSGHGTIVSDNGNTRQVLAPGDFALIPAWTEHQEVNDGDEEVTWIITRSGGTPEVVNLEGWSGKTVS